MPRNAMVRSSPPPVIVLPARRRGGAIRRAASRARSGVSRVARDRRVRAAAPTAGIVLGGVAVGYLAGKGWLDVLPPIMGSRLTTLAILGYAATRVSKNPQIRAAGLAMLGAGAFALGEGMAK